MEHIVQFAISIDDKTIQKRLEENAYNDICEKLVEEARDNLPQEGGYRGEKVNWRYLVDNQLAKFVEEHKDEIINAAAEKLKDSYCRSKAYRDKMKEVIE